MAKEYIEREAMVKASCERCNGEYVPCNKEHCLLMEVIHSIPAADVRPVVLCADCEYNTREVTDLFGNNAIQCITGLTHRRDWFCADGKKREEN